MTLPQNTIDQINAEAEKYGFVVPYDRSNKFYNEDKVKGYQAGATECAGKAQGLVDSLEAIIGKHNFIPCRSVMIEIATAALAKYKEVENG